MIAPTDLPPRRQDHCTVADCGPRWNEPACIPSACPCPHHEAHECPVCGQDNDPSGPGCACYGIPTPLPHHPTSAEMAAFRATFRAWVPEPPRDGPRRWTLARAEDGTYHLLRHTDALAAPVAGAWGHELRDGIGYRQTTGQTWAHETWSDNPTIARREASALRSRAYSTSPVLSTPPCYWCGRLDFHNYSCCWNVGPKSAAPPADWPR